MTTAPRPFSPTVHVSRRDTLSAALVFALTVGALIAGYWLRLFAENKTTTYSATGVTISYPDTWVIDPSPVDGPLVRVSDLGAAGAPTTFEVRRQTVNAADEPVLAMATVANDLALTRARSMSAFKLFGIEDDQQIKGVAGTKSRYVFVQTPDDIFGASLPAVVLGTDYLVHRGDQVYVFTLHAAEDNYPNALPRFERFVADATLP